MVTGADFNGQSALKQAQVCLLAADKSTTAKERRRHLRRLACELRLLREARRRKEHPLTSVPGAGLHFRDGFAPTLHLGPGAPLVWREKPCRNGHDGPRWASSQVCLECSREKARLRHEDPDAKAARAREARRRDPERAARTRRRNHVANPLTLHATNANWRAKEAGADGRLTAEDVRTLFKRAEDQCQACGSDERLSIDHVIPISRGGRNNISNTQVLCLTCNRRKYRKIVDYREPEASMT